MPDLPFARKSLGQHWLLDKDSLQAICLAADLSPADTVLEIGPGIGSLTELLAQQVKKVVAVELDEQLAGELLERISVDNVEVISQDILKFDLTSLPQSYKLVANIPYYLTSHLLKVLSESTNPPVLAVLLIQKEVAERVTAKPGNMSLLSVSTQLYWEVSSDWVIPAKLFTPPPKVDSQILILQRRPEILFNDINPKDYLRIVKAGFAGKRKTLLNSLSGGLKLSKSDVTDLLRTADIDPSVRAQNLSLDDWYHICQVAKVKFSEG
jgi:16S rRNA (adenine1518-N6/adenine1519-N6)-dimethyltransferase